MGEHMTDELAVNRLLEAVENLEKKGFSGQKVSSNMEELDQLRRENMELKEKQEQAKKRLDQLIDHFQLVEESV